MRPIKFRAWDKKTKEFRQDNFTDPTDNDTKMLLVDMNGTCWVEGNKTGIDDVSDRFILMQYTGLKDKQSKEIYEGDIVESSLDKEERDVITFKGGEFNAHELGTGSSDLENYFKVIGNIYENKELLEEEK